MGVVIAIQSGTLLERPENHAEKKSSHPQSTEEGATATAKSLKRSKRRLAYAPFGSELLLEHGFGFRVLAS